ncbi:hypothetical protein INQ51_05495 [Maribellus sp. CM-23]|uniref:DUF4097 family beta strand repeat-containing protein n=1 Tax=Maribellus sp. CM-23 TaxID=2781026 RepID=UPI001F1FA3BF|nr:DUF4097 family beta strand repeat-containing protein [Maribellus sp. CM-23]MCE4563757.1 hypothetical protein [Maribellus sp. CM-23]
MKTLILSALFILSSVSGVLAQKVINEKIEVDNKETFMEFSFARDIVLEAWDKDYIELHVEVNIDDNQYNDFYNLDIEKGGQKLKLKENIDFEGIKKERGERKLNNFNSDVHYSLKVPEQLKFSLKTISGEVELIGCKGAMKVHSISGFIDYTIPETHRMKIDLSTVTGEVYSNVEFDGKTPERTQWVGTKHQLSLNGGSTEVDLETVSGDIFLRKR